MTPPRDDSEAAPKKPARWVSPWSFDDDYAVGQLRHDSAALESKLSLAAPATEARPMPKARSVQVPVVTVATKPVSEVMARETVEHRPALPHATSLVKSFHSFGDLTVTQESPPTKDEEAPTKLAAAADLARFEPPLPTHQSAEVKREPLPKVAPVAE
ncbi:MAG: hypothetical protein ABL974_07420, partial [Prosthecobacter sp.]